MTDEIVYPLSSEMICENNFYIFIWIDHLLNLIGNDLFELEWVKMLGTDSECVHGSPSREHSSGYQLNYWTLCCEVKIW